MRFNLTILTISVVMACVVLQPGRSPARQAYADAGVISGTVFYENGMPVKGATASAVPLGRPIGAIIPHADTDSAGHFAIFIPESWFGKFAVTAKKEDEDYPEMNQFYSNGKFQTVMLTERHPTATVTIRLGPKAGVLRGTVTDRITGSPLIPCTDLRYAASSNFLRGTGLVTSKYRLLLPSNRGIFVKVWLDGYQPWYYPGTANKSEAKPIRLGPGEEQITNIRLQPDRKYANVGCPAPLFVH